MKSKTYLEFTEAEQDKKKTKTFWVSNKVTKDDIGEIKWCCAWRQYCFYPDGYTHWSRGCLKEVFEFIDKLMENKNV